MRIVIITQNEPFYLTKSLRHLLNILPDNSEIVGCVVADVSPFGKKESFLTKAKKTYVDISKWTIIMSQRHARQFYAVFDIFSKVIKIMRAYMVAPYGIRWEERRKKCFIILSKDSHFDMQLMSRRHAEYENMLEIR